jgi:hypothetical protein
MFLPHFGHKFDGNSSILVRMKNAAITCVGLVCLSSLGGYVLFASHTALAAGPKLPQSLMSVHAVTADTSARTAPAVLRGSDAEADVQMEAMTVSLSRGMSDAAQAGRQVAARGDATVASRSDDAFAPYRALRPVARQDLSNIELAQQEQQDTRPTQNDVAQAVPRTVTVPDNTGDEVFQPTPRVRTTPPLIRPTSQTTLPVQRRTSTTSPEPGYWFGVFR